MNDLSISQQQPFLPEDMYKYFLTSDFFKPVKSATKYIAGFESESGLQVALQRTGKKLVVFAESGDWLVHLPTEIEVENYAINQPRNSNLAANAPKLAVGNEITKLTFPSSKKVNEFHEMIRNYEFGSNAKKDLNMSYLLTWNPDNFSTGGDGSDDGQLDYHIGEIVRWSCHTTQPKIGDTVFLIKLGSGVKGLIAKGKVVEESYSDADWRDDSKQRSYIKFELEALRKRCDDGIVSQTLLKMACPNQQWSPQSSGISIKPEYQQTIEQFWSQGENQHSLTMTLNWLNNNEFKEDGWYANYTEMCQLAAEIKQGDSLSDADLTQVWSKKYNGIASVGQGFMYKKEFEQNQDYLRTITLNILNQPTKETYDLISKEWKLKGQFERVLWSVIRRVFAMADNENLTSIVGDEYLNILFPLLKEQFEVDIERKNHWIDDNNQLIAATAQQIPSGLDFITRNILLWMLYEYSQGLNSAEHQQDNEPHEEQEQVRDNIMQQEGYLNRIFYGPPGTGKTYHIVQMAVNAAEPDFVPTGTSIEEIRQSYKSEYDRLLAEERIRFVTFHQSYGYEEFVEGLSAKTEGNQLSYFERDGIFKSICDDAKAYVNKGEIRHKSTFDELWQQFSDSLAEADDGIRVDTLSKKTFFTITDVTNSTIRFDKSKGESVHTLSVKTLRAVYNGEKVIKGGLQPYYGAVIQHLNNNYSASEKNVSERKKFVLVIDEINRGNISKIFGELITLIEPSKRMGQPEALEVTLPYSGESFAVPDNLFIIGTMNTADRSLALMDTALRRRFNFIEMMPDYSVLYDDVNEPFCIEADDAVISLPRLLEKLNNRISALYDREHVLGHAFLMPVVSQIKQGDHSSALSELADCFQNKIIPLLAEYFFEDWEKIRLVLADTQKEKRKVQTVIQKTTIDLDDLFGDSDDADILDDLQHEYRLTPPNSELWSDPLTYIGMYDVNVLGS